MMSDTYKLVFLDDGVYNFDLQDLLGGSLEVLGKGSVGTSYKSKVDEEDTTRVVKIFKDVTVTKNEFKLQMDILGKVPKHENVLPVIGFHFSENGKLLFSDYMTAGSLPSLLHGNRVPGRTPPLDSDSRMKIARSIARGLSHLHASQVVHGNIKSSNVLLRPDLEECCLSDYGLNSLFGTSLSTPANRVTRFYCAPEVVETGEVTFESDVYSFGVLLLELLTGKAPNSDVGEDGMNLPKWVQSTPEVLDVELMRHGVYEMVQLLQNSFQLLKIAMSCVTSVVDQRPSMKEVVRMIEDLKGSETN